MGKVPSLRPRTTKVGLIKRKKKRERVHLHRTLPFYSVRQKNRSQFEQREKNSFESVMQVIQLRKQNIVKVAGAIFALLIIFAIGHHIGGGSSHHKKHKKVKHESAEGSGADSANVRSRSKRAAIELYDNLDQ